MRVIVVSLAFLVCSGWCVASSPEQSDSVSLPRKGFLRLYDKVVKYFSEANVPKPEKKIDISFIGGPHYSTEAGFGIGIVGAGTYYSSRGKDGMPEASTPPSQLSLKLDVTTGQLYKIGAEGYHIFRGDKFRINYDAYFYSFKDKFWGIGYKLDSSNANESIYKRLQSQIKADFVYNLNNKLYIGPIAEFTYINATRMDRPELLEGQSPKTFTTGVGVTMLYDTRDMPLNAYEGVYVRFDQLFNPRFLGNRYAFSQSELTACAYAKVWKGGVLATMFHANLTYGNTPWGLLPTLGGSDVMRGYYEGRYRDKNEMDLTVELRQKVWRRNGLVVWVGAGTVFPKFSVFKWYHVLPNYGIGYRWEFKQRVNVRLDLGFGRGEKGFNFSINEAF